MIQSPDHSANINPELNSRRLPDLQAITKISHNNFQDLTSKIDHFNKEEERQEPSTNPSNPTINNLQQEVQQLHYKGFKIQLKRSFKVINKAQEAKKKLRDLRQKGLYYKHTLTFIQLLTKRLRTKFIKPTNKPLALLILLRKPLKLITANRKGNRREKPRKVAILLNTTHRLTKEKNKMTILLKIIAPNQEE
ncbi:hypothetical protein MKX08_003194 [Trichoderma sp. CBMAI-0020]|nr:hypothetical protein MKX08_003194 [Trichoderma sp. CBMAI-0020]